MSKPLLRAFPMPVGVGTDICHIPRIYNILEGPEGSRFIRRVLTDEERRDTRLKPAFGPHEKHIADLHKTKRWQAASFLAGRFAAKEAVFKAHGLLNRYQLRPLTFHDIVIESPGGIFSRRRGSGPPVARIKPAVGEGSEDECALVSISHDHDYVTAVCIAYGGMSDMYTDTA